MFKVAILEDNPDDARWIARILADAGHNIVSFGTAASLLKALRVDSFDAALIDWTLPDIEGVEVVARIRTELMLDIPLMMVTARGGEADIVTGLKAGADDFVAKPVAAAVLLARLDAITRRQQSINAREVLEIDGYCFRVPTRQVMFEGSPLDVTEKEFALALTLFRHLARAVSRDYLTEAVWGHQTRLESRSLDVHISRVRRKLMLTPERGWRLATVYGYGYRLERTEVIGASPA